MGRLKKRFTRSLIVSWREQPTRFDIEALQANIGRVGLVVRVRWILIGVLVAYSLFAAAAYATRFEVIELARLMAIPAFALGVVVLYNTFYTMNYRRLGNIAVWNNLQLALDALVVTVLVYFSGGVNSWFWSMYALFVLEATFILPRSRAAWLHALFSMALLGAVEWSEFAGWIPHIDIPFSASGLHHDVLFVSVRYLWQVAVLLGTAWVATNIVGEFRSELASRRSRSFIDEATGLYSRPYFLKALSSEIRRAERDGRELHVLVVDIDRFGEFNNRFGIDRGDQLVSEIAAAMSESIAPAGDVAMTVNIASRFGGEEFAILFAEDDRLDGSPSVRDAVALAEQVRIAAAAASVDGAGVTVSVGVATFPSDGRTADELLDAGDVALGCAFEDGGNVVITAADCAALLADRAAESPA